MMTIILTIISFNLIFQSDVILTFIILFIINILVF